VVLFSNRAELKILIQAKIQLKSYFFILMRRAFQVKITHKRQVYYAECSELNLTAKGTTRKQAIQEVKKLVKAYIQKPLRVNITWSERIKLEELVDSEYKDSWGIYQISSKPFLRKESLIYIGKAYQQNFLQRANSPEKLKWLPKYSGTKFIRCGIIELPDYEDITSDDVEDIESAFIYELKPPVNKMKVGNYSFVTDFIIHNYGEDISFVPTILNMKDHW
jgi:hypothetical protein